RSRRTRASKAWRISSCSSPVDVHVVASVDEAGARRLLECCGERAVLLARCAGERGDAAQMILRLIAVALFDLPQPVVLPGLDVIRLGLQRAIVPDLRDLVVAELAIRIADQVGGRGAVVAMQRLKLIDGGCVFAALVDRSIGGAITRIEGGLLTARAQLRF